MARDLDKALSDILTIRNQIAAGTAFQGYGPMAIAVTGLFAAATTFSQATWLADATGHPLVFFGTWILTALLALLVIGIEMRARAYRHHSGLADEMIYTAVEHFIPAGAAGVLLALVIFQFALEVTWIIPGLWHVLVGVGTFAASRNLPRGVSLVAAWYFVSGLFVLIISSDDHSLSPWTMGVPFMVGQLLTAAILHTASERARD